MSHFSCLQYRNVNISSCYSIFSFDVYVDNEEISEFTRKYINLDKSIKYNKSKFLVQTPFLSLRVVYFRNALTKLTQTVLNSKVFLGSALYN